MPLIQHMVRSMSPTRETRTRRARGFTLIELMIVVAVVGILATVAYPSYVNTVISSQRAAARAALTDLVARQETYFTHYKQYAATITALGFPSSPTGLKSDGGLVDLSNNANPGGLVYKLQVSSSSNINFKVEAVPTGMQTQDSECSTLFITAEGTHGAAGSGDCW